MKITTRKSGDITIFDVEGKLLIDTSHMLRSQVREALDDGSKKVLLNLAKVTSLDSAGLGELISSYTASDRQGAKLKLENPPQKIYDLLMITKLITVFEVYDTEQEAIASFK